MPVRFVGEQNELPVILDAEFMNGFAEFMNGFHHAIAHTAIPVTGHIVVASDDASRLRFGPAEFQFRGGHRIAMVGVDVDPVERGVRIALLYIR